MLSVLDLTCVKDWPAAANEDAAVRDAAGGGPWTG